MAEKVSWKQKVNKYVEYGTTKLRLLIEQKKFTEKGITYKYILKKKSADTLIVVLSSCTRKGVKARYNYMRTLKNVPHSQLYILDDFAADHRGGYYIGSNFKFDEEPVAVDLIKHIYETIGAKNIIFCGSSKGGWAALNFGLQFKNAKIIIGSPQYFLGDYLVHSGNLDTLEHIIGEKTEEKMDTLNHYLEKRIICNRYKDTQKIVIHYSNKEHTYEEHIKDLLERLYEQKYCVEEDVADYMNHSDISYYFPQFMLRHVV